MFANPLQQLTGLDALFLTQEATDTPMHIGLLMFYQPVKSRRGPVRFKDILGRFGQRAPGIPVFYRTLGKVPLGIDYPFWLDAQQLDIEFHVRHIALPRPGDWRQLCIQVARLQARILDRSRPLWEAYVIEGLDNIDFLPAGSFAIFFKMHHAAVDGASAMEAIYALHDRQPRPAKETSPRAYQPRPQPGPLNLFGRAYVNRLRSPGRWLRAARDILPIPGRLRSGFRQHVLQSPHSRHSTRFNGPVSPHRVVEVRFFDLDEVRALKKHVGDVTINDVMVTVVAGALRKYLESRDELPDFSPMAMIPVSFRSDEEREAGGNLVTAMSLAIHSEIEDPLERLQKVHEETLSAKAYTAAIGARTALDLAQLVPPQIASLAVLRAGTGLMFSSGASAPVNTVITNVAGSPAPHYLCGAELVGCAGFGPIMDSVGLFHAVMSCGNSISIAVNACREMLPDPDFYAQCLQLSYLELRDATIGSSRRRR
ncbi:MAG: wax ester/triacylglycerol synthase family O-acyltransferase [Halieaceae bacterium]|nr:wax ester/triacylglycerol synthase family O-acyltransferase [Halieaceae bacterium]